MRFRAVCTAVCLLGVAAAPAQKKEDRTLDAAIDRTSGALMEA